jgi:hypothetical protein
MSDTVVMNQVDEGLDIATVRRSTPADKLRKRNGSRKLQGDLDDQVILSPIDALYAQFVKLFGNSNQDQIFSLIWPGTILKPSMSCG